ncbi:MAG TPA: thiamine pyrophosphate-binding protein [Azonexus sp.]|nr:thiamine pyrophosphate-binding protein [Azonexus sp.]
MRAADYLMQRLAEAGATEVFLLPGGGAMFLNDALVCEKRLNPVPCHHEQACGIAAEAHGRVRETFGVCMVTTGPGGTNAITPVAGAWIESIPLLIISGQVKRPDLLAGRPLRQSGVQEVDIVPMVRHITKYAVTIDDPQQIRYHLERALYEMCNGRAGPVWLDVPLDVQAAAVDPEKLPKFNPPEALPDSDLTTAADNVLALLANAERPLILAGHGVRLAGGARALLAAAERLQIPVATTWNALDIIPANHPLCAGRPGVVALRPGNFAVQNCDLLISIGCRLDNIITAYNPRGFARAAQKVVIDVDRNEIDKLDMDIALGITADAADFLAALNKAPAPSMPERDAWLARIADWKARYPVNDGQPFPASGPINHYHFVSALSAALPPDMLIATGSSGLAVEVFYTVFQNKPGQRVFLTSGLGSMGYGLPAAIGACFANGKKPMVAIESDGSLQLNLQELATLRAQNLPICLIVMNNGGYASIRNTQRNYFAGRHVGTGPETGLLLPDLEQVAATYGLPFKRITDAADLAPVLNEVAGSPQAMIVDVQLTPNEILAPKCAALPQPDGSMLSMPLEDMSPLLPLAELEAQMLVPLLPQSRAARPATAD